MGTVRPHNGQDETYPMFGVRFVAMPRSRSEPPDLTTQSGRLVWARSAANYPSSRAAARILRWNENTYKSHETGERGKRGIPPYDLEKYAKAFDVDLTWLAFGKGSPKAIDDVEVEHEQDRHSSAPARTVRRA